MTEHKGVLRDRIPELLFAAQMRSAGIAFEPQYRYVPDRKFRADFWLVNTRILVEIVGGIYSKQAHGSVTGVLQDIERLNLATLHGYKMVRYTPDMVEDGRALEFTKQVLGETEKL